MDVEFAKELENVIKKIYEEYPGARGYLTNLTLTNLDMSQSGVIALFMPIFTFGTSNTKKRITDSIRKMIARMSPPKNNALYNPIAYSSPLSVLSSPVSSEVSEEDSVVVSSFFSMLIPRIFMSTLRTS